MKNLLCEVVKASAITPLLNNTLRGLTLQLENESGLNELLSEVSNSDLSREYINDEYPAVVIAYQRGLVIGWAAPIPLSIF